MQGNTEWYQFKKRGVRLSKEN